MPITAIVNSPADSLRQEIFVNDRHWLVTDEPEDLGGTDTGPTPYELLPAALAGCVATTLRMYARRKGWALDDLSVEAAFEPDPQQARCTFTVRLPDGLTDDQYARLDNVAAACAVHRVLGRGVAFEHRIVTGAAA